MTLWLNRGIKLPRTLEGLKPTLILPLLGTAITGLAMVYVVGRPVAAALTAATTWLQGLGDASAGLLGAVLGLMMALTWADRSTRPRTPSRWACSVGPLSSNVYGPIAAAMAAGMTPPLALFFATLFFKNRFTRDEHEAGRAAGVLGAGLDHRGRDCLRGA